MSLQRRIAITGLAWILLSAHGNAVVCTTQYESVSWSIDQIVDGNIAFVSHDLNHYTYRADLRPTVPYKFTVSATTNSEPGNDCWWYNRSLLVRIPAGDVDSTAGVVDGANALPVSFSHTDVYWPEPGFENVSIEYNFEAMFCGTNHTSAGHPSYAWITVEPLRKNEISFYPPYRGDPDPRRTQEDPPKRRDRRDRYKPPEGCNRCSSMGLPGFRVNTATLNLLVMDTEFAYSGVGPSVAMTRYYNADPTLAGMFGPGWSFSYGWFAIAYQGGVYVQAGDGSGWNYRVPTNAILADGSYAPSWDGNYATPSGHFDRVQMTTVGGKALFTLWNKATRQSFGFQGTVAPSVFTDETFSVQVPLDWIEDENGNTVTVAHTNASGFVSAVTDAAGRTTTFEYGANGLCSRMNAPDGRYATYTYSGNLLTQTLDLAGKLTTFTYTADTNKFLSSQNTEGKTWRVTYAGPPWHVASVADAGGFTNTYDLIQPAMSNRAVQKRDSRGGYTTYFSQNGLTTSSSGPGANSESTTFLNGLPYQVTDSLGQTRTTTYDARGNLALIIRENGSAESFAYNAQDRLAAITNSLGYSITLAYDARGNLTNCSAPDGRRITWTYDSRGLATSMTIPGSGLWTYGYDSYGNIVSAVDPAGHTNSFAYSPSGLKLVSVTDAGGNTTTPTFDDNQRLTRLTHPDGTYREYTYDCCAQTAVRNERGVTNRMVRDSFQNVTQFTDALGFTTYYTYDAGRNLVRVQHPDGTSISAAYDALDLPVAITNPSGSSIRMAYNPNGELTDLWTTRNGHFAFDRDNLGRLIGITYPNNAGTYPDRLSSTRFSRDSEGLITNISEALSWGAVSSVDLVRNLNGKVVEKKHNGITFATYAYDTNSLPVASQDATGLTTYSRNSRGLVTNIVYPDGLSVRFTYDARSLPATVTYPGGLTVAYARDTRGRATNMAWGTQAIQFQMDAVGNVTNEARSNGTQSRFTFDAENRLTGLLHSSGTNVMIHLRYDRNSMGFATNTVVLAGALPIVPPFTPSTNRGMYDASDEITNWNGTACLTDWRGNVTNAPGSAGFSAEYDAESRLVSTTRGATNTRYAYNGFGQRARSVRNGQARNFRCDHRGRLLFETSDAGAVTAQYIYRGPVLVAMWTAAKGYHFYHFDKLGNTIALTDEQGRYSAIYRYLPYGGVASSYQRVENPFTFVGRYGVMDEGSGLFFMRNRYYEARLGRFLQRDPICINGGINVFAYAAGNPVEHIDPSGFGIFRDVLHFAAHKSDSGFCQVKSAFDATVSIQVYLDLAMSKLDQRDYSSLSPSERLQLDVTEDAFHYVAGLAGDMREALYGPYDWRGGADEQESYGPGSRRSIINKPFEETHLGKMYDAEEANEDVW